MSTFKSIHELNKFAVAQVIPCVESIAITEYFTQARSFLQQAGICGKTEDKEREYMFLVQYLILVIKRIPLHPQIYAYYEEYAFNKEKCLQIRMQVEVIRDLLMVRFGEKQPEKPQVIVKKEAPVKVQEKDPHFENLSETEKQEVEDMVRIGGEGEKRKNRIIPLPGIDDFSQCMCENVRKLEQMKSAMEIYKEIRALRHKYRHGVIDFQKKIRAKEKLKEQERLAKEKQEADRVEKIRLEQERIQQEQARAMEEKIKLESNRVSDFVSETMDSPATKIVLSEPQVPRKTTVEPPKLQSTTEDDFNLDDQPTEDKTTHVQGQIDEFFD